MTTITVDGLGERHLAAERVTLTARVAIAHRDRPESIAQGTAVHARLAREAASLRETGAATWHSVDPLSTNVRTWTDKDGRKHQDHVTAGAVRIKLGRLEVVSDVVATLSALGATVSPSWALTEATKLRVTRDLRGVAVRDARTKADDFAAALGAAVGRVTAIREAQQAAPVGVRGAGGGAPDDLTIPEITVRVAVTGEYETD
ncbi:SIMPL domain-containing protein [Microbacterium sp. CIAB417]|uniref:SIMPL domain-containing protein n=1 Tax=Microbacterium sp. CIAB417 TaxID=2860287 RepID=UPI001FAC02FC|nr:SIMPL domain-containing protein [Microbacterium sp. CIAB417]